MPPVVPFSVSLASARLTWKCWNDAEPDAGCRRQQCREHQHGRVDANTVETRNVQRTRRDDRGNAPLRQEDAGAAGDRCEEHALDEQLTDNPAASGAERGANRHLAATGNAAGQQQIGNVRARDQQDAGNRREQDGQRGAMLADDSLLQRRDANQSRGVALRVVAREPFADRAELGRRLLERRIRLKPRDRVHQVGAANGGELRADLRRRNRQPRLDAFGLDWEVEAVRRHADDRDCLAFDRRGRADR